MKKNATIIQFPSSKKERKKILDQQEDVRLRVVYYLRRTTGFLLAFAVIAFCVSNYELFMEPSNIIQILSYLDVDKAAKTGDLSTVTFESGSADAVIPFGSSVIVSDKDSLYAEKPGGYRQLDMQLPYGQTVLKSSKKYILAFDRGGTGYTIANVLSPIGQANLHDPILSASIGENGSVAVVTDETGYKGAVTVYNVKQEQMYKWSSSEYYIMSAVLSPDSQRMASICFRQDGVNLVSKVFFFNLKKDKPIAEIDLTGQLALDVKFLDEETVSVICDNGAYIISQDGRIKLAKPYAASELIAYDMTGDKLVLATKSYSKEARMDVVLIDGNGKVSQPIQLRSELRSVSYLNGVLGILTSEKILMYDDNLKEIYAEPDKIGARSIKMRNDGNALLISSKSVKIVSKVVK